MKKLVLSVALISGLVFSSCEKETVWGEGPVVTETRSIDNFTGVSTGLPGTVNVTIGPVYRVEVSAQQNVLDVLRTQVVDGILQVDFKNSVKIRSHEEIVVNITMPSATILRLSGSGNLNVAGNVVANNLQVTLSGSGNISAQTFTIGDKLDVRISGSGNINVTGGTAENEELRISGSGNINLSNTTAKNATTNISGSGDIRLNVLQALYAHISGSGSVLYKGTPVVTKNVSGSGTVRPL